MALKGPAKYHVTPQTPYNCEDLSSKNVCEKLQQSAGKFSGLKYSFGTPKNCILFIFSLSLLFLFFYLHVLSSRFFIFCWNQPKGEFFLFARFVFMFFIFFAGTNQREEEQSEFVRANSLKGDEQIRHSHTHTHTNETVRREGKNSGGLLSSPVEKVFFIFHFFFFSLICKKKKKQKEKKTKTIKQFITKTKTKKTFFFSIIFLLASPHPDRNFICRDVWKHLRRFTRVSVVGGPDLVTSVKSFLEKKIYIYVKQFVPPQVLKCLRRILFKKLALKKKNELKS